ncbi:MAG TPA: LysR family transcriptional regulator substrate-binding protein, partial [Bryobacteraceae bacterium]|nr:LysR family transcriptional regulator substrate-binding protein [Bryobacteraceae bacterium]
WRQEEMVVASSPFHPLAQGSGMLSPEELQGIDFIGFDDDLPIAREIDRFLSGQGIKVNITFHFDNIQMIKEAVAHRTGVSIMPARIMKDEIAQGRLVAIPIAAPELYRPLGIIHRKKKRFYPVAQAFLELLCEKPTSL